MFLSKRANGIYYVYYYGRNGKRTCKSTKSKFKMEALKFLTEFSTKVNREVKGMYNTPKMEEFFKEFLQYSERVHTWKTTLTYKTTFNALIKFFGNIQLDELGTKNIEDYLQHRIKEASIHTGRKDIINIKASLNWAVENEYLLENPSKTIKRIKTPERLPIFFSQLDFKKLIAVIDIEVIKDIVLFAVNTGMRQNEILNLRLSQIDYKNRVVHLDNRYHLTKSKKIRTIPLNETAYNVVIRNNKMNFEERVFMRNGLPIKQDYIVHKFKKYINQTGLNPKLNFHSLRHTFASWLVQNGVPIYEVSKLLGHSDIKTTEIYSHLRAEDLRDSVNLLNN